MAARKDNGNQMETAVGFFKPDLKKRNHHFHCILLVTQTAPSPRCTVTGESTQGQMAGLGSHSPLHQDHCSTFPPSPPPQLPDFPSHLVPILHSPCLTVTPINWSHSVILLAQTFQRLHLPVKAEVLKDGHGLLPV